MQWLFHNRVYTLLAVVVSALGVLACIFWFYQGSRIGPNAAIAENSFIASDERDSVGRITASKAVELERNKESEPDMAVPQPLSEAYLSFIDPANAGDLAAQHSIGIILEQCRGVTLKNMQNLESILSAHNISVQLEKEIIEKYGRCEDVLYELGDIDINERRMAWLQSAADAGNTLAQLQLLMDYPDKLDKKELAPLISAAVNYPAENLWMRQKKYELLYRYYKDYVESSGSAESRPEVQDKPRSVDVNAWEYLSCKYSLYCKADKYLDRFKKHFHTYEVELMLGRAAEIQSAIQHKDIESLNLH